MARVQLVCKDPSRTKQSFKKECDINLIMKKYKKVMSSNYLDSYNSVVGGQFGDFSNIIDYRTALDTVGRAESIFMGLPAVVRSQFGNDTAVFLDFVNNPANAHRLAELGLVPTTPAVKPPVEEKAKPV
nr:MAG: internal scaffolding protein [Microviridae sp.]